MTESLLKIADIHVARINMAIKEIGHLFPLDADKVSHFINEDIAWVDLLTNRFGKLQDYLGSKLINVFLENLQENTEQLTMLDKVHKLERFGIIENSESWKLMREVRNHIAHEYPDHPEITANYLNRLFELTPELLTVFDKIKKSIIEKK